MPWPMRLGPPPRIDEIVGGLNAETLAQAAHIVFGAFPHFGQLSVGEAVFLGFAQHGREFPVPGGHVIGQAEIADVVFHADQRFDLFLRGVIQPVRIGAAAVGGHGTPTS